MTTPVTSSTTSSTVATTVTLSATSVPPSDDQRAIEAVERFYNALNQSLRSLSTKDLRAAFRPGCLACEAGADKIDQSALAGRHITGGNYQIRNLIVLRRPENTRLLILRGELTGDLLQIKDSAGRVIETESPISSLPKTIEVFRSDGGWIVSGVS